MEIERKWMVNGWPEGLPLKEEFAMRQGYISVRPTVRIREEALTGGKTHYVLCFKSGSGLAREEIERDIDPELFNDLETKIIGRPLIPKLRRSYLLPDGAVRSESCGRGPADGVLVRRGGVPHGRGSPQLAACRRGPRGLPERRSHRPARPEHGGLLGADPGLNRRKLWKNPEDYDMMVVSLILRPRTGRERRKQLRNDPNSRCLCSTIRRSS